jgi:membrane protease subunit (stomatin/prohibitin family)
LAIIDVVKWDGQGVLAQDDELLAWKFPSSELSTWTQLIVNESQEALLFRGGSMDGPFGPGRHVLKTENLPVLGALLKLPFGRSPFTAEVWYTNRVIPLNVKWGTPDPIRLQDPVYNIIIPVVARGQYAVQIEHSRKFIVKLVGTMREFDRDKLRDYLRGMILTTSKTIIAKEIVKNKTSLLEIAAHLTDLSAAIQAALTDQLAEFGLNLVNFLVDHIDVVEDDRSVEQLRESLAKRADMNIRGYNYQQERSLNAIEGAAGYTLGHAEQSAVDWNGANNYQNDRLPSGGGGAGGIVGLGVGLGVGVPMGAMMGQAFSNAITPNLQAASLPVPPVVSPPGSGGSPCTRCNSPRMSPTAKFCPGCGTPYPAVTNLACGNCKATLAPQAKFCPECGIPTICVCTGCGASIGPGIKFCSECGTPRAAPTTT